jgi:hypothetical protein
MNYGFFRATLVIAPLTLIGCASTAPTEETLPSQQMITLSESESAELVVVNISGPTLIPSNLNITDGGLPFICLPRQTYKRIRIKPGSHEYRFDHSPRGKLVALLQAEVGRKYYLLVGYSPSR